MPSHLVVGIDGSDESAAALRWAVEDARRRDLDVELVYGLAIPVVSDAYGMVMTRPDIDELCRYSESLLDAARTAAQRMDPDVAVRTRLLNGPPAAVLIEASKEATGLVVGSRGIGAISGRMLGSVSVRVAAKACCPVYVIPPDYDAAVSVGDPVVVGVDGSAYGDAALRLGFDEARCRDTNLMVVVAYHVPWLARPVEPNLIAEFSSSESQQAHRIADETLARVRTDADFGVGVEVRVVECQPPEALIAAGKEAMLTIVGSRGRTALSRALLGSVSRAVLQEATRPVAVVRFPPKRRP
jgi:nucleotide-binding universal stress UspA family protein